MSTSDDAAPNTGTGVHIPDGLTAATLIEALSTLPPDTPIFNRGYEFGMDRAHGIRVGMVVRVGSDRWWAGEYEWLDDDFDEAVSAGAFLGVRVGDGAND
jgi:hypothetical protein